MRQIRGLKTAFLGSAALGVLGFVLLPSPLGSASLLVFIVCLIAAMLVGVKQDSSASEAA